VGGGKLIHGSKSARQGEGRGGGGKTTPGNRDRRANKKRKEKRTGAPGKKRKTKRPKWAHHWQAKKSGV